VSKTLLAVAVCAGLYNAYPAAAYATDEIEALRQELHMLKKDYEQRIQELEKKLQQANEQTNHKIQSVDNKVDELGLSQPVSKNQNSFNPAISLILDGQYASYDNALGNYQLPGFMLGEEAGLANQGLTLGESEITLSSNIDDKFFGQATISFEGDSDATTVAMEEAFIQTLGLGNGLTLKAGRFFSAVGYLNEQHAHAWDFSDAPLIYRGLFGNQLADDGVQLTYLLPTDTFMQFGVEALSGSHFPAGGHHNGIGAWSLYYNIGDDMGVEHSWQLGINHWQSNNIKDRQSLVLDSPTSFSGESKINSLDFIYKWAPNGNPINHNFKLQFEYFDRREDGIITAASSTNSSYDGQQSGWYAQGVYQFMPQWRTGIRYDQLHSNNTGSNGTVLTTAGLNNPSNSPKRYSAMLEWLPSEFSRIRLQYNRDESYQNSDNQFLLQYTHSLGSHGAHQY